MKTEWKIAVAGIKIEWGGAKPLHQPQPLLFFLSLYTIVPMSFVCRLYVVNAGSVYMYTEKKTEQTTAGRNKRGHGHAFARLPYLLHTVSIQK